jgi:hypothetical protein
MSRGVIYIVVGTEYVAEAVKSAASLKKYMPNLPITLFSSETVTSPYFDTVKVIDNPRYHTPGLDKISYMYDSPYEYILFLDSDTYICTDFWEIFNLLDLFDMAVAHAPFRIAPTHINGKEWIPYQFTKIPESFPEMNTGVILYKKSYKVEQFFQNWLNLCEEKVKNHGKPLHDQATFRSVLYESELRTATLTPEYNCRFIFPVFVSGKVKILHGRPPNFELIANKINSEIGPRIFTPQDFIFISHKEIVDEQKIQKNSRLFQIREDLETSKIRLQQMQEKIKS